MPPTGPRLGSFSALATIDFERDNHFAHRSGKVLSLALPKLRSALQPRNDRPQRPSLAFAHLDLSASWVIHN
jgi:hypothetical protein